MVTIRLGLLLLLLATSALAQEPGLWLVADRDSVGVGDTLEVRVLVAAPGRRLTSASAAVVADAEVFAPLGETTFAAGDFLPGTPYDNTATAEGRALQLRYVAVSGTTEDGSRLTATGSGELARLRLRALAPSAGTSLRLEGTGPQRAIYTEEDFPGVEQRFALPALPLRLRVGGEATVPARVPAVSPPVAVEPEVVPPELAPSTPPPASSPTLPPPNTAPTIGLLPGLRVAVGGESYGLLLAAYLADAEDSTSALLVEVEGDGRVAARLESGRLVVRGLEPGTGIVVVRVADPQGATASAQVAVAVLAAGQGPLLRALPKVSLRVGAEKSVDLVSFVYDPDTPLDQLRWLLQPETGVEAWISGSTLGLRGRTVGPARVALQVADPEGNVAMAALAVQVEVSAPEPAPPPDTVLVAMPALADTARVPVLVPDDPPA
ncbi:MAG: hypothetical protein IT369_01985, partial [Candidatus Latescibacteria bacterium]|nr:hypothetical protein [Candidatus Latescibacterota bacterium]